jgi:putative chitinase
MVGAAFSNVLVKFAPAANKTILAGVDFYFRKYAPNFGITTPKRIANFLSQAAHESDNFKTLREYASGAAYEGRKDLGNTVKGDGVKFRGRGIFQVTGRANYTTYSKKLFNDTRLLNNPELLEQPEWAVLSALHYWNDRKLNALADVDNVTAITRAINGGTNGLTDRKNKWSLITSLLSLTPGAILSTEVKKKLNTGFGSQLITDGYFFLTGKTK